MNKTNYLKLSQPQQGDTNWGNTINDNFGTIDQAYKQLQSSIAALEKVNRQEGYFNFIPNGNYILLNSIQIAKNGTRLISKNKGSQFAIIGTIGQENISGNHRIYFTPLKIYYFGESWGNIELSDINAMKSKSSGFPYLYCTVYAGENASEAFDLYIETEYENYADLCNGLQKEKFIFLDNNTGFYNYLPVEPYDDTSNNSLYSNNYLQHELIIKYVNYGDVVFTSYSNAVGGVYVPQKELNSDVITFVRTPVVNSERTITASLNPYYVYGGIYDVDFSKITKSGDGYSIEIPNSKIVGKSTSNNDKISLQNISLEFYDKTNGYSKVIVDYKISLGQDNLNLTVYGISETNKNKLLARVTYLSTQITDVLAEQYVQYGTI